MKNKFLPDAKLKIDLGGDWKFEGSIREVMRVDPSPEGIDHERENHPGTLAWLGVLKAKAKQARVAAQSTLDQVEAEADCATRQDAENSNKKVTEKYVASIVDLSPRVTAARDFLSAATYTEEAADAIFVAYRQRKDFIVSFADDLRGERSANSLAP